MPKDPAEKRPPYVVHFERHELTFLMLHFTTHVQPPNREARAKYVDLFEDMGLDALQKRATRAEVLSPEEQEALKAEKPTDKVLLTLPRATVAYLRDVLEETGKKADGPNTLRLARIEGRLTNVVKDAYVVPPELMPPPAVEAELAITALPRPDAASA